MSRARRPRALDWVERAEEAVVRGIAVLEARMESETDPATLLELSRTVSELAQNITAFRAVIPTSDDYPRRRLSRRQRADPPPSDR